MGSSERIGGAALIAAAAGTVLGMAHHPTSFHSGGPGPAVHAAMIVFVGLSAFGFSAFAGARGAARPAVLAGGICYAIALFGHVGAATINGFVTPAVAKGAGAVGHDVFLLAWETNQALATLGVFAAGLAILLWSVDFLARESVEARAIGGLGFAAGAGSAALLLSGAIEMDVTGAFIVYAVHAAWGAAVGFHLLRGKVSAAT